MRHHNLHTLAITLEYSVCSSLDSLAHPSYILEYSMCLSLDTLAHPSYYLWILLRTLAIILEY